MCIIKVFTLQNFSLQSIHDCINFLEAFEIIENIAYTDKCSLLKTGFYLTHIFAWNERHILDFQYSEA